MNRLNVVKRVCQFWRSLVTEVATEEIKRRTQDKIDTVLKIINILEEGETVRDYMWKLSSRKQHSWSKLSPTSRCKMDRFLELVIGKHSWNVW